MLLPQRAHLCAKLAAELVLKTFGFLMQFANHQDTCSVEFAHYTLALVAAARRMLKTRVTLGKISRFLLNLSKLI